MSTGIVVVAFTAEFERMTELYARALGVQGRQLNQNWCEFPLAEGARFALHRLRPEAGHDTGVYHLNFIVDDVGSAMERFRNAGAEIVRGVTDEAFGKVAALRDADGRTFDLVQEEH